MLHFTYKYNVSITYLFEPVKEFSLDGDHEVDTT